MFDYINVFTNKKFPFSFKVLVCGWFVLPIHIQYVNTIHNHLIAFINWFNYEVYQMNTTLYLSTYFDFETFSTLCTVTCTMFVSILFECILWKRPLRKMKRNQLHICIGHIAIQQIITSISFVTQINCK